MKGKVRERLLVFALTFAMIAGMIIEPVQIHAVQPEGRNAKLPAAEYSIKVSEKNGKTEAYTGEALTFIADFEGTEPSDPTVHWSADHGAAVSGSGNEVTVTVPDGLTEGTKLTVTAECGGVSGSAFVSVRVYTYTVSGSVTANSNGVSGATVMLKGFEPQTTDESGFYSVLNVPNGTYELTVSRAGFEEYKGVVTVTDADVTNADVTMTLAMVKVSIDNSKIVVGETTSASVSGNVEFTNVTWQSSNTSVATVNGKTGEITGVMAGSAAITPIIQSNYGSVPAHGAQVTVGESGTEITELSINKRENIIRKQLIVEVKVGATAGNSTPTGGKVKFIVKQEETDENIPAKEYEENLEDGKAALKLTRKNLDFSGKYVITVQYLGNPGYYEASNSQSGEYNYAVQGLTYLDEKGKSVTSSQESPMSLTYGEQKTIWVAAEDETTIHEVVANVSGTINIQKQDTSTKPGYTEFLITAIKAGENTSSPIFKKTNGDENFYSKLYVKVNKKELYIDIAADSSSMKYSKIYDDNRKVFADEKTQDSITLEKMALLNTDIVPGDEIWVDTTAVGGINGTLPDDFPLDATTGLKTTVTFNQNQLKLTGDKADNYVLADEEVAISATVIVRKRPVEITVSDAERSFGHAYHNQIAGNTQDYIFNPEDWLDVQIGTGDGITGIIEKGYQDPSSEDALVEEQAEGNAALPGKYTGMLSVDTKKMPGIHVDNYEFNIRKGTLIIKAENIENLSDYIQLENSPENPTMYFGGDELWVKADKGRLKLSPKAAKLYDEVLLTKVGETVLDKPVSLTNIGYEFHRKAVKKSEEVTLTLKLTNKDGAFSKAFSYKIYLDNTVPTVTISSAEGSGTPLKNFVNKISFGWFGQTKYKVNVQVTEADTSGLKEWTYMVLPLGKDMENDTDDVYDVDNPAEMEKSQLLQYIDSLKDSGDYTWKPMSSSNESTEITIDRKNPGEEFVANNYVVLVKPYDNVKNSKIYTSLGIILDDNDPYVELDLDYDGGQVYRDVYNDDVKLQMSVTDNNKPEDKTVSGLKEVYYQVAVGEENLKKAEKLSLYKAEEGKGYTLEELQKEVLQRNITIDKKLNSNDIWVRVTAVDNSGNLYQAVQKLKIDITKPDVFVRYETKATEDYAPYYKENRTAIVTVKERNVDISNIKELWFDLQREGEQKCSQFILSSLDAIDGITVESIKDSQGDRDTTQYTDDRTIEMRICFSGDNKYNFDVHCVDKGDWENEQDHSAYFVIDKTTPELSVAYWNADGAVGVAEGEEGRFYSREPMAAKVEIKEHNFAYQDKEVPVEVKVTASKVGKGEEIPDYAALEKTNSPEIWSKNVDTYTSTYNFSFDANYTHSITYTDLAGNTVSYGPGYFTVDKTNPTGTVEIKGFGFWESLLEKITFGLFSPSSVDVVVTGADHTSPVNPVQFARFHDQMTRDELEAYNGWSSVSAEKTGSAVFSVNPDEQFIIYTKVTDNAGNYQFFSSNGMIVDGTKPAPAVTITNLSQSQNGIFNENVTLRIDAEDPTAGDTYSGLEKVWYTVSGTENVNVNDTIELLDNSSNRIQGNKTFSQTITIPADVYNSNNVKVQAFAADFSGNQGESEVTELKIDVTNPVISVSWDLNSTLNGRYYKDTRTATVTVTDRNFDPDNVRFSITNTDGTSANMGRWSSSSNIGVSDAATSTCQVSFPADGDYTFTLECTDLAGNSGEYGRTDEFTIDKTAPVMTVSYDNNDARNGNYFKEARTAAITIHEHNFNAADVRAAITASLERRGIFTPSVGAFSGSGDIHTATVSYSTDGDYTFDIDYTDMAGNKAADYTQDSFTVDLTAPELEITDVEDKSANNDAVSPKVEAADINYDAKGVTVTLTGVNNGSVEVGRVVSAIENGQSMKFYDFARTEEMDDLYKMTVKVVDKAGNETEKEIMFSVNRYGSVFVLDEDTKDWLMTGDEGYTYIRKEKEVGIREINVDAVESRSITVNRDGDLQNLKENADFTVKNSGSDVQWKEAHYTIAKENFAEEGNYTLILNTQDKAKNSMNNTSVKKANKNLPIEFTVDKTAPTVVVSGVEDNAQYRAAERTMTVDAKDNLALTKVTVDIDGTKTVYEGKELLKNNGVIETAIASANRWQSIEITAEDAAGNVLGQSEQELGGEPVVLRVLVTPNIVIQYYMNKPLFYGSIAAAVVMAGLSVFLVWKKITRKN